jgi:hypothetical protein
MTMNEIIRVLTNCGYVEDGATAVQHVRIPTTRSPVFGGIGGEAATFGGRARLKHSNGERVTVGKISTNFYRWDARSKRTMQFAGYRSKDIDGIRTEAQKRTHSDS